MKIYQLFIGMMVGVNYVIMSQAIWVGQVVMKHGNTAAIRHVEKYVKNHVTNANNFTFYKLSPPWLLIMN